MKHFKNIRQQLLLLLLVFGAKDILKAQSLTLEKQQEDFTIFKISIQQMHAGLYWFITPKRLNALCDSVYSTLKEGENTEQFYLKIRYCMAALKHGHDGVDFKGEPLVNYRFGSLHKNGKYLPFILKYLGNKLYILNNCSNKKSITNGSEILAINGKPIDEISGILKQYIFANGRNETYRYAMLGEYYHFHYLYQMLYGNPLSYTIDLIPLNKKTSIKITVDAVSPQTIADAYTLQTGKDINSWGKLVDYKFLDAKQKTGYLKLETFSKYRIEREGVNFDTLLENIFVKIKKDGIKSLIVDIRNNEGGDDTWMTAISYFKAIPADKGAGLPYFQNDTFTYIKYVVQNDENRQLLQLFQNNPYAIIDKMPDGRFKLKQEFTDSDTKGRALQKNAYNGRVYLLQNGLTFSAGFAFANKLNYLMDKDGNKLKVIGEQNADDEQAGVGSGGWGLEVVLPNSKIVLHIPITGGGDKPYARKLPVVLDYKVIPTIQEKIRGTDTEVEFAKKLIDKKE